MANGEESALEGLRVLDASGGVAGQYAGKLFAGFGAEVVLVEPPEGTPTRRLQPAPFLFEHLSSAKLSVGLDPGAADAARSLAALCRGSDVVLRDATTAWPIEVGPEQVECVLSEFPTEGALSGWKGTEMIHQALGGAMWITGDPDRRPLFGIGQRAYYATGVTAFVSCVAALLERRRSGRGQRVSANVFEAVAAMGQNQVSQYSYNGRYMRRGRYPGYLAVLECRDGWIVLFALRNWPVICDLFGVPEMVTDPRFDRPSDRLDNWPEAVHLLQEASRRLSAPALVEAGQKQKVSIEQVLTVEGLATSRQWTGRGMTITDVCPDGQRRHALGPVYRIGGLPYRSEPCGPVADDGVAARWAAGASAAGKPGEAAPWEATGRHHHDGTGPLQGVTVIDLTTAWAGPMATRALSFLGARVIKVEAPTRLDAWRGTDDKNLKGEGVTWRYPDYEPGERPYNRSVLTNTQCHDKWSLSLDIKKPGALEVIYDLAAHADLVVANFSSGTLDRMGVGFEELRRRNPGISVIEMPAFGAGGPMTRHVGMGNTMEAACGMASLIGYGDGAPVLTGTACLDPIGGINGSAAAVTALWARARTGKGVPIEVAQTEAASQWIGEYVLEQLATGTSWQPLGNWVPGYAPHDAFRAAGEDAWVAIAVGDDEQWAALCALIGRPDLVADERFATPEVRWEHQEELRAPIEAWTAARPKQEAAAQLQAVGVAAAPVNTGEDVAKDPTLREIGFVVELEHPEAGRHEYPSLGYRLERTPGAIHTPAPCFAQHNRDVLQGILGYDEAQIAKLYETGAVTDAPVSGSGIL